MDFSIILESHEGKFIVNRFDAHQPIHILRTGHIHISNEVNTILALVSTLSSDSLFLDIGANVGMVSIPVARALASKNGRVVSIEPQRLIYYMLAGNIAINSLANVYCYNIAISDEHGEMPLPAINYLAPQDFGIIQLGQQPVTPVSQGIYTGDHVAVTTVDAMGLQRCDFIKIDIEGMEINALRGASATINNFRPWIWCEHWLAGIDVISDYFSGKDYIIWKMDELNLLCAPAEKVASSGVTVNAELIIK